MGGLLAMRADLGYALLASTERVYDRRRTMSRGRVHGITY